MLLKKIKQVWQVNKNQIKKYSWMPIVGFAICYWVIPFLGRPYVIDEAAFPYAAKGVSENWKPFFYNGETRPNDLGIWHPPLYVYILGIWIKIFGFSPEIVRLFGIFCLVLTSLLIKKTIDLLRPKTLLPGLVGALVYISHYFVIQSALIPDIDGTLLPLVISIFIYVMTRYYFCEIEDRKRMYFYALMALGLNFSTKLTTTMVLIAFFFILDLAKNKKILLGFLKTGFLALGGFFLFLSWWYPLAKVNEIDWLEPINFTINSFRGKSSSTSLDLILESMISFPNSAIAWIGPPTFISVLVISVVIFSLKDKVNRNYFFALIFLTVSIWLTYNIITGAPFTFPKYWNVPIIPTTILLGSLFPSKIVFTESVRVYRIYLAGLISVCFTFFNYKYTRQNLDNEASFAVLTDLFLIAPVFIGVLFITARKSLLRLKGKEIAVIFCVFWILFNNVSVNSAFVQQDFSTRYYFGERGESEIITKVKEISMPGEIVMAPKDVGLQVELPFYEDALLLNQFSPQAITEYMIDNNISLVIVRKLYDYSALVYPDHFSAINKNYKIIKGGSIGDFEIWRKIR
jgi:hypothetical protein